MARRIAVALVIALVIAISAVLFAYHRIASNKPVVIPPVQYVAASHAMQPGQVIAAQDLSLINWPRGNPLSGAFTSVQAVVGRAVLYPLAPGEPVLDQQLATHGAGAGITAEIPKGMRAVALHTDQIIGVAGFVMPGTHVDVLVTYRVNNSPDPITSTILQNVEVLAVGHQLQPDASGKAIDVDVVTLLLSPEDAEKAVLAAAQGTIHFVLRDGQDTAAATAPPVDVADLSGSSVPGVKPVRRVISKASRPRPWVVETVMGNKLSTDTFK